MSDSDLPRVWKDKKIALPVFLEEHDIKFKKRRRGLIYTINP
jgi:hypothetical protein